jgi:3-methyladenine DNA glycosylase AlkD
MSVIVENIRKELIRNADEKMKTSGKNFFKEEVFAYGVKTSLVISISKEHFKKLPDKDKATVFGYNEELWRSGMLEETFIASNWSYFVKNQYSPEDIIIFRDWINKYVSNWASCDTFCNHTVGTFIEMYPGYIKELKEWAKSENRWMRRASAVSLIVPARKGKFLAEILKIAGILLTDEDDMVRKGYGWMLKESSKVHQKEIYEFVVGHKSTMPRTAYRYAIEKMPPEMRRKAMEK